MADTVHITALPSDWHERWRGMAQVCIVFVSALTFLVPFPKSACASARCDRFQDYWDRHGQSYYYRAIPALARKCWPKEAYIFRVTAAGFTIDFITLHDDIAQVYSKLKQSNTTSDKKRAVDLLGHLSASSVDLVYAYLYRDLIIQQIKLLDENNVRTILLAFARYSSDFSFYFGIVKHLPEINQYFSVDVPRNLKRNLKALSRII